jgi:hypothetical protein
MRKKEVEPTSSERASKRSRDTDEGVQSVAKRPRLEEEQGHFRFLALPGG